MKVTLLYTGKTDDAYILEGYERYESRLKHYLPVQTLIIPALKNTQKMSMEEQKDKEGELILSKISAGDYLILLDENGKQYTSVEFSRYIQLHMNSGVKNLIFVTGGPYGFSAGVYQRANAKISLSRMTFSHQMVRLFFIEQLYRAMTILKGEPYHHQ